MRKIQHSLLTVIALLVVAVALVALSPMAGEGQGRPSLPREARKFYLTRSIHDGNEALTACTPGYHMASLWEIFDPTQLRYDTSLGLVLQDSGSGPPSGFGYVRTGMDTIFLSNPFGTPPNCRSWTSDDGAQHEGTVVSLTSSWLSPTGSALSPWQASVTVCSDPARVWCVED